MAANNQAPYEDFGLKLALLARQKLNERYTADRWKDTVEKKAGQGPYIFCP